MTKKQNDHFGLGPISERHRKHLMSLAPGTHSPLDAARHEVKGLELKMEGLEAENTQLRLAVEGLKLKVEGLEVELHKYIRDAAISAKNQERMLEHVRELQAKNSQLTSSNKAVSTILTESVSQLQEAQKL